MADVIRAGRGASGNQPGTIPTESQLTRASRSAADAAAKADGLAVLTAALHDMIVKMHREMKRGNDLMRDFMADSRRLRRSTVIAAWQTRKHDRNQRELMRAIDELKEEVRRWKAQ